jgi:putative ABC transport system permease protein
MSLSRFFRRGRWDDERARELEAYLAEEIDDNIARGMPPDEAKAAAHRKLGNPTLIREEIYEMNTMRLVEAFWQDLKFGTRLLIKNPTFSIVAILTLALGTGANAAIFQLVNSLRLRPLPVERPQELVALNIETNGTGRTGRFMSRRALFTEPQWRALEADQQVFSSMFAWGLAGWNLATDGEYQPARGMYVSGRFFETLGVGAHIGRVLTAADDVSGCGAPGAVLGYGFWQSRYGGNPAVVGQSIALDNRTFPIVGVTPASFFGVEVGRTFDVAVPLCAEPIFRGEQSALGQRSTWFLDMMGRLAPGVSLQQAQAQLAAVSPAIFQNTLPERYNAETANNYLAFKFTAAPAGTGVSGLRTAYATQLWVLLGATGLVLLITCANLANLMLARATAREREIAVRLAIGASRRRLIRQMLSESLLIAVLGAVGGAVLSGWFSQTLVSLFSTQTSQLFLDLAPDWRVFAFIAGIAIAACLLFGLSPALRATHADPGKAMQAGGRSSTDSHERFALRRALVVVQVALSMVLIVGALLFGRSLRNLTTVDPGFRTDGVIAMNVDLRRSAVDPAARTQTYLQIMERIRAVPGVRSAAEAFIAPMSGSGWNQNIVIDGQQRDGNVDFNRVGNDYFAAMETTLIAGRAFGPEDRPGSTPTAIVNESFARMYFGGGNPVGRTFQLVGNVGEPQTHFQIVGLVKDTKYNDLRADFGPIGYFPAPHETEVGPFLDLIVRSDMTLSSLTPTLTQTVRDLAPNATVSYDLMSTYIRDSLVTERLMASLSMALGGLAMLIATIGLYGVMSYMVSRRRVEIGIRMALGAEPRSVVRMVLGESGILVGIGVVAGIALAIGASSYAASLLYGLEPWDPISIALAIVSLGLVSLIAAWIPARRASRLAPTLALRAD